MTSADLAVVGRYFNQQGGVSNVMAQLAIRSATTHPVTVYANEFLDWPENLRARHVPMLSKPKWAQIPSFARNAGRLLRDFDGIIHSHDPQVVGADIYTAHSCFKSYIHEQRTNATPLRAGLSRVYLPHVLGLEMARRAYNRDVPRLVAVSRSVREQLLREYPLPPSAVSVIYNGVDTRKYSSPSREVSRKVVSEEIGVDLRSKLVLIFVGYEFERKRLDVVMRALADAGSPHVHLLVVGGAPRGRYEQLANDLAITSRVTFLGHRSDVPLLLRAADVFAFPTKYEAASLAILEAAAAGLALVTTDTAMAGEVLTDGHDALLIENVDDHRPFQRAIESLADDAELFRRLGAQASSLAATFSWDSISQQYEDLYADIVDGRTR